MAEFCTCGSLVINEHCTNKNCSHKAATKTTSKASSKKSGVAVKKEAKPTKTRKSSKCVTYNLYEPKEEEEEENVL